MSIELNRDILCELGSILSIPSLTRSSEDQEGCAIIALPRPDLHAIDSHYLLPWFDSRPHLRRSFTSRIGLRNFGDDTHLYIDQNTEQATMPLNTGALATRQQAEASTMKREHGILLATDPDAADSPEKRKCDLVDLDILDCPICKEPLFLPVFQVTTPAFHNQLWRTPLAIC